MERELREQEKNLLRVAIKLARGGDTRTLRFLLDRLLPKHLPQPVGKWKNPTAIYKALRRGKITPQLAEDYFKAIKSYLEIKDFRVLEERIKKLEGK